jgi:hypothetical protein
MCKNQRSKLRNGKEWKHFTRFLDLHLGLKRESGAMTAYLVVARDKTSSADARARYEVQKPGFILVYIRQSTKYEGLVPYSYVCALEST